LRTAADDPEAAVGRIIELAKTRIPSGSVSPVRDIQVLSPMNRGGVGARLSMPVRKRLLDSCWTPTGDLVITL
jgi:exodeoxyribonuclease V alpha subunit